MGRYIGQSDIENLFGAVNVSKWSNIDNYDETTQPNTTRITAAIAYAEDRFDDRMRNGILEIPLTGTISTTVKDICVRLAGVWLYEARGVDDFDPDTGAPNHRYGFHRRHAEKQIDRIIRGELSIDHAHAEDGPTGPVVI